MIRINDNPTKWFTKSHPIRVADRVLNKHFGGTYMAYLALQPEAKNETAIEYLKGMDCRLTVKTKELKADIPAAPAVFAKVLEMARKLAPAASSPKDLLAKLRAQVEKKSQSAKDEEYDAWDEAQLFLDSEAQRDEVFKDPAVLRYIAGLQAALPKTGVVGKSNSIADIVKTVHRELLLGKQKEFRIPDTQNAVGQCLITYQNSHRPYDLWHFVTPDYRKTSLWIQLKSGDNKDMEKVVAAVDRYFKKNPPPIPLRHQWFGLTYINVVWQNKMVTGMLQAFLGSFLVVFLMMTVLFRSALWGVLSMIPLTVTIAFIYGLIGIVGKDYDMPVAVLSSLSLGLAVDFAIHFLARSRKLRAEYGSWEKAAPAVFGEPARAISRNVIVIAVGFLPLLAAPLVPYKTVGVFIATILAVSGVGTLFILPALVRIFEKALFPEAGWAPFACNCATCVISAVAFVALAAVNAHQFFGVGWIRLMEMSLIAVPILAVVCYIISHQERCKPTKEE
ncbi:MAG: MMPL family transporter [Planctomycetes bacterium]|nr:MMPL family transporter [Planctomycetota bacterium]